MEKRAKAFQTNAEAQEAHNRRIELGMQTQTHVQEEHPYKPKIDVYLRYADAFPS